ncbi:MAG: hypothetical protein ACOX4M_02500 [Acetivibrionales bacterium]|jgi:transposase-like protein
MYENITYAELKSLPREQKVIAWKELKNMYSTQKELAEKLGVSPNLVYNMISRYVNNAPDETEKDEEQQTAEQAGKASHRRRRRKRRLDSDAVSDISGTVQKISFTEGNELFSISIKKIVAGEDAQFLFSGIGGTMLKDRKYMVEVKITEI